MPFGIRPSNVRVCHFTTRAIVGTETLPRRFEHAREKFRLLVDSAYEMVAGSPQEAISWHTQSFKQGASNTASQREI